MSDFRGIIQALGGPSEFARAIGLKRTTHATTMVVRNSIAPKHWPRVIKAARMRGIPLSHDALHEMYDRRYPSGDEGTWSRSDIAAPPEAEAA